MTVYYNEVDPFAAQWLRNLISAGCIAPGDVDERDIRDVKPRDLSGYTQCHFFAGIGVWSYALRQAGWADGKPVWTGSCPCQPFSAAGARGGVTDERHLWPHWHHLVRECQPTTVFGEQVASADGLAWLDLVCSDLEAERYAVGAADLCAAGSASHISQSLIGRSLVEQAQWMWLNETDPARKAVWREFADYLGSLVVGAPHIRQRLYFVGLADADDARSQGWGERGDGTGQRVIGSSVLAGGLADGDGGFASNGSVQCGRQHRCKPQNREADRLVECAAPAGANATDSVWRDPDWLLCRDGRWRPVEPGTFPLAHGVAGRVDKLRAYGNATCPQTAAQFIEAVMG